MVEVWTVEGYQSKLKQYHIRPSSFAHEQDVSISQHCCLTLPPVIERERAWGEWNENRVWFENSTECMGKLLDSFIIKQIK